MNKTEQMITGFHPPAAALNHRLFCVHGGTRPLAPMGEAQMLRVPSFRRLGRLTGSDFRRWNLHRFSEHACRATVDCLAMVGCVLFGALATLLFGL